ncbi:MAG TPA: ABC transporter ATP-binding protein [Chloroflexota bacterium]|jgi:iron(III) transport system ATP-binding protein|nr:ABC transporter ATP-binding protein [Chloroflexota bacterium]
MQNLRVVAARKAFGPLLAVNDVTFDVNPGEMVTLLGPSGCGKTTTLRLIAGLEQGDGGQIFLGDRLLSDPARNHFTPPEQRSMGMVFQNYAVWPHMTVGENVGFPLRMKGVPKREIAERTARILDIVGLGDLGSRPAPLLSGGQQQRVALARALVFEPEVLLLDEPLSNLDARLREELRFELKELQRRLGITTVVVTHDQKEAMVLSDRIIVMNRGRIEQVGQPVAVYQQPLTPFVLEFLGATNYLPAQVADRSSLRVPDAGGALIPFPERGDFAAGGAGRISFRAEDVTLERLNGESDPWAGHIVSAAFLGHQFEYVVQLGNVRIHAPGPKYDPLPEGARVKLHVRDGAYAFWVDPALS